MRVWLDDVRPMKDDYDVWCKTAESAIDLISCGHVTHISFDHDLGTDTGLTGYDVAKYIENCAWNYL